MAAALFSSASVVAMRLVASYWISRSVSKSPENVRFKTSMSLFTLDFAEASCHGIIISQETDYCFLFNNTNEVYKKPVNI